MLVKTHPAAPLKEAGALIILSGYVKQGLIYVDEKIALESSYQVPAWYCPIYRVSVP